MKSGAKLGAELHVSRMMLISVPVFAMSTKDDPDRKLWYVESISVATVPYRSYRSCSCTAIAADPATEEHFVACIHRWAGWRARRLFANDGDPLSLVKGTAFVSERGQQCPPDAGTGCVHADLHALQLGRASTFLCAVSRTRAPSSA